MLAWVAHSGGATLKGLLLVCGKPSGPTTINCTLVPHPSIRTVPVQLPRLTFETIVGVTGNGTPPASACRESGPRKKVMRASVGPQAETDTANGTPLVWLAGMVASWK